MQNLEDDDIYVFEPAVIKLTPYDRRRQELRELQEKRDEVSTLPNSQRRLAGLEYKIEEAQRRFEEEQQRATDDSWRRLRDIDDWRSRDGRELRNTSRRKVRSMPNDDLSDLTKEQKDRRKGFQRADANFIARNKLKGVSEAEIQAGLLLRQQKREIKQAAADEAESALSVNPTYGMF